MYVGFRGARRGEGGGSMKGGWTNTIFNINIFPFLLQLLEVQD